MDVVYDVVESIHIFIPLIAIVFVCVVLYFYNKRGEECEAPLREGWNSNSTTETKKGK